MSKLTKLFAKITKTIPEGHEFFIGEYHDGEAEYVYIPSDSGHIFDGDFKFVQTEGSVTRKAEGHYWNNQKDGRWHFSRKDGSSIKKLSIDFAGGEITGDLKFTFEEIIVGDVVFTGISMGVTNGHIQGKILGSFNNGDFEGYCDDEGYADGEWTLTFTEGKEMTKIKKEIWNHGVLEDSYEESLPSKHRTSATFKFRERINILLDKDISHLLYLAPRGTKDSFLHIHRQR